jgi:hypothetical protein
MSISNKPNKFLPTTKEEMKQRGWDELDVVLITGDAYIDSPFMGIAVVGRILEDIGLRVGIIGQPDINSDIDSKYSGFRLDSSHPQDIADSQRYLWHDV